MTPLALRELQRVLCICCGATGRVALGEHYVTREMALDAGDASLEGSFYEIEYGDCPGCYGNGWLWK